MRVIIKLFKSWKAGVMLLGIGILTLTINFQSTSVPQSAGRQLFKELHDVQRNALPGERTPLSPIGKLQNKTNPAGQNTSAGAVKEITNVFNRRSPGSEVQHIAFLKVHKAASSTAQNIFLRFGWHRNLTFVLPPAKNPTGYPNIISLKESLTGENILPPPKGRHYDIMCNHVFYASEAFQQFMPSDTAYIGIVREPFELYKSILNYFRPGYIFNKIKSAHPGSEFLRSPSKYEPKGSPTGSWTRGRMALEYNFPRELFDKYDAEQSAAYIKTLDKEFLLIIISELMEESIVLMRRLLNWHTKDILYVDQNVARKKNETMLSKPFDRDFYQKHAPLDFDLYEHFYKRLRKQIREQGDDFDDELLAFRALRKNVKDFCGQDGQFEPMVVEATHWGPQFNVTRDDCKNMVRGEIDFITRIRIRQYGSKDI